MKKVTSFIIILLISISFLFPKVSAKEIIVENLINPKEASITITENEQQETLVSISNLNYIQVEENKEYFIIPTYINDNDIASFNWTSFPLVSNFDDLNITFFDESKNLLDIKLNIKRLESKGNTCGYSIKTPQSVKYIKFENLKLTSKDLKSGRFVDIYNNYFKSVDKFLLFTSINNIYNLDVNYKKEYINEDTINVSNLRLPNKFDTYLSKSVQYVNLNQTFSNLKYYTSVNNPVSIDEFMTDISLTAIDEVDGDRTGYITYDAINYMDNVINKSQKERVLGAYPITFKVKDESNNEASCTININVIDDEAPVLDEANSILKYELEYEDPHLTLDEIINNIVVTDNYDLSYTILTNDYEGNEDVIGDYPVNFIYSDSSGNSIIVNVYITVIDSIAPVISSLYDTYETSYQSYLFLDDILDILNVRVSDNYLKSLSYKIDLDEYTGNESTVGTYLVKLSAKDSSHNITTKDIIITIFDNIPPVFYYNETKVSVMKNETLTANDYKEILINRTLVKDEDFVIEVISDNYSENKQKVGKYEVGIKVNYEDSEATYHKIIVNVSEEIEEDKTFIEKVWAYIKKIFQGVWNIVSWPFKKVLGLF